MKIIVYFSFICLLVFGFSGCLNKETNQKSVDLKKTKNIVLTGVLQKYPGEEEGSLNNYQTWYILKLEKPINFTNSEVDSCDGEYDDIEVWVYGYTTLDSLLNKKLTIEGDIGCPRGINVIEKIDFTKHDGKLIKSVVDQYNKRQEELKKKYNLTNEIISNFTEISEEPNSNHAIIYLQNTLYGWIRVEDNAYIVFFAKPCTDVQLNSITKYKLSELAKISIDKKTGRKKVIDTGCYLPDIHSSKLIGVWKSNKIYSNYSIDSIRYNTDPFE